LDGSQITSQHDFKKEAIEYFQNISKAQDNLSIIQQLDVIRVYPRIFSEEGLKIVDLVLLSEVLITMKGFVVSQSPGPDG